MVIVRLQGGLGNQMFQYAAGRRLAHARRTTLKLDISSYTAENNRYYSLGCFNIEQQFATTDEIRRLKGYSASRLRRVAFRFGQRMKPYYQRSVIAERRQFAFNSGILDAPRDVYLVGYWQNENYFSDIEHIIRREFTVKPEPDRKTRKIRQMIESTDSVALHIRRGDYVTNPRHFKRHGVCSLDYYNACVGLLARQCTSPHFFVFSDEPEWAMQNLQLHYPCTIVTHNGTERDYEDLRLMSLCKHFVIANSTFSWWGAWLSTNKDKVVFAPRRWFSAYDHQTGDPIPPHWHKV